jgi:hypothetical protein
MPCQFNKLTINTTWSICFQYHRQDGDFIGNYRIRLSENVGFSWDPIGSCGVASTWVISYSCDKSLSSSSSVEYFRFFIGVVDVLLFFRFSIRWIDGRNNSFNNDKFRRINNNWFTLVVCKRVRRFVIVFPLSEKSLLTDVLVAGIYKIRLAILANVLWKKIRSFAELFLVL